MFCTVEDFWPSEVVDKAAEIDAEEAVAIIAERIIKLNPAAQDKKIIKFIRG